MGWHVELYRPDDPADLIEKWEGLPTMSDVLDHVNEALENAGYDKQLNIGQLRHLSSEAFKASRPKLVEKLGSWVKLERVLLYKTTYKTSQQTSQIKIK
jgi:hypothetical protein